jgi:hypothetical protein
MSPPMAPLPLSSSNTTVLLPLARLGLRILTHRLEKAIFTERTGRSGTKSLAKFLESYGWTKPIRYSWRIYLLAIFCTLERGGRAAAIYYSIVESCKLNKVNPLTYLTYVLSNVRNKRVTLLRPHEFM